MSPHTLLGIKRNATVQEVKQAYARLLKLNRPDDDAVAFQNLQQAFEYCMEQARNRPAAVAAGDIGEADENENENENELDVENDRHVDDMEPQWVEAASGPLPVAREIATPEFGDARHPTSIPIAPGQRADVADALIHELLQVASRGSPAALEGWLNAQEALYSLDFKREFSERVLMHLGHWSPSPPWQVVDVLYRFFDVSSVVDSRLRRNFGWRELWDRVRGEAEFEKRLGDLRPSRPNYVEKLIWGELFNAPDRSRRLKILLLPTAASQLRTLLQAFWNADRMRAEMVVGSENLDYWMAVTDPARLDWRRTLPVMGQFALVAAAFAGLIFGFAANKDMATQLTVGTVAWLIGVGVWWAWTLFIWGRLRYFSWRARRFGPYGPRPGDPLMSDPTSAMGGFFALLSLLACGVIGFLTQSIGPLFLPWAMTWFAWNMVVARDDGKGRRWDAWFSMAGLSALLWLLVERAIPLPANVTWQWKFAFFTAAGCLLGVVVDHHVARLRGISMTVLRSGVSYPLIGIAVVTGAFSLIFALA